MLRGELHLLFERTVQLDELAVHGLRGGLQVRVLADEFVALNGVLHRGEKFLVQPRLDDETENFPGVDCGDDGVEIQHAGGEDARGERLELPRLRQQFEAGQPGHDLVGNDDGKFSFPEFGERIKRRIKADGLVAETFQQQQQDGDQRLLVVHHENWVGGNGEFVRRLHVPAQKSGGLQRRLAVGVGAVQPFQIAARRAEFVEALLRVAAGGLEQNMILAGDGDEFVHEHLDVFFFFRAVFPGAFPFVARVEREAADVLLKILDGVLAVGEQRPVARLDGLAFGLG